jgi:quinol monooxygenase YgiN
LRSHNFAGGLKTRFAIQKESGGLDNGGTIVGGLKVVTVAQGREHEFEALFAELRKEIRVHEPGCLLYSLLKSRKNPRAYIVHEQYIDQAALDAHQKSPHGARYFPKIRAILEKIVVEYFDGVVD